MSAMPKAVQDCHLLLGWLLPKLDTFPRQRRFTLGEKIEQRALEVLENLIKASYSRQKKSLLYEANTQLTVLRHLWRLAYELKAVAHKSYQYGATLLVDLGQQIGGWQKAS